MGILRNYEDGNMNTLRSVSYSETGTKSPYVTKDVTNPPDNKGLLLEAQRRIDDTSRIAQLLVDKPGLKFIGNQALLQQEDTINKLRKGSKTEITQVLKDSVINTAKKTTQILGSTLAQVPVNGTGTHFVHGFRTDTYLQPPGENRAFAQFFGAGGVEGAPLALQGEPITGDVRSKFGEKKSETEFKLYENLKLNLGYDAVLPNQRRKNTKILNKGAIESAKAGNPIKVENREVQLEFPSPTDDFFVITTPSNETTPKQGDLGKSNTILSEEYAPKQEGRYLDLQDFRDPDNPKRDKKLEFKTYSFNYNDPKINIERRVRIGNPGKISRDRTSYTVNDKDTRDNINFLDVKQERPDGITESRDLIQLGFQVITPEKTYYLAFRAFLDSFDDSFNATWNSHKYLGRAEDFYTYQGFDRSINLGFKIAAQSREEMKPIYRKAATLASVTAPTYGDGVFMRGSIAKITVGDYIYEQPGIIESVSYTWQTNYPWEISFQNPEGKGGRDQVLPHLLDVSVSFKVIHDFLPQTGTLPFITNHRAIRDNKDTYISLG